MCETQAKVLSGSAEFSSHILDRIHLFRKNNIALAECGLKDIQHGISNLAPSVFSSVSDDRLSIPLLVKSTSQGHGNLSLIPLCEKANLVRTNNLRSTPHVSSNYRSTTG